MHPLVQRRRFSRGVPLGPLASPTTRAPPLHDNRVAPWSGTAHGVLEAINTYEHHQGTIRAATPAERKMLRTVTGSLGAVDRTTWRQMALVLPAWPYP